ncbi:MAG: Gfo/Idh/MocA family oxidoreductase [Bdellovibrionaceae bacterium]|nr:Gfo/Idh/MocA family oxidoreductase [Bdellovibrionales bacterium]MCB9255159.1 Gfo/Idh/MocA family oxidoreductase [Pseudobdellovibrionaceae bacterium]
MNRKLRMGMVGGGREAFIGAVHRMAAGLDGLIELSAGAFSSDPQKSQNSGKDLFLPAERVYDNYRELFEKERVRPDRMDFVSIVTPNHTHFDIAMAALDAGFPVMCEKPMTFNLEQAQMLRDKVSKSGLLFGLTHNYTGYPMVKEARALVASNSFGKIRKVVVEYPQGWLSTPLETSGQKQASWRTDPGRAGASCCVGDIGTHAANLAEYITGSTIESVCADVTAFVPNRQLDDDANVLLRFANGAHGVLHASQICVDEENGLNIRVYGEHGGLWWRQEEPNSLHLRWADRPRETLRTGANYTHLSEAARAATRLPAGHPEGFIEAFANLYRNYARTLMAQLEGKTPSTLETDFPGVQAGVRGMAFIQSVIRSSDSDRKWTDVPHSGSETRSEQ